jgi:tetratricopeptide (TPR) repeat protein
LGDYKLTVVTTWAANIEQVEKTSPKSAAILRICAFLAPTAIPEIIFLPLADNDPLVLGELLAPLVAYSLCRRNPKNATLEVHRLVQTVVRDVMDDHTQKDWVDAVVLAVNAATPSIQFANWTLYDQMLPHLLVCAEYSVHYGIQRVEVIRPMNQSAAYLYARAQYKTAIPLFYRALTLVRQVLGSEHLEEATILNNLAACHCAIGDYDEAFALNKRAAAIREKSAGPDSPEIAQSINNLALLYRRVGQYEEALPLYKRALEIREKTLGPDHPDTAMSLSTLGELYRAIGQNEQAMSLHDRALRIRETVLGPMHPDTATSLNNLSTLYFSAGRYGEALPLIERAVSILRRALGADHPTTKTIEANYRTLLSKLQSRQP